MKTEATTEKKQPYRIEGWDAKLNSYIETMRDAPFEWGANDCVLFCADAIKTITGIDPIPKLRGKWTSKTGAHKALKKLGGLQKAVEDVAKENGWREIPAMLAQRGDLMFITSEDNTSLLAINVGASAVAPGESGGVTLPSGHAVKAWHIS